MNGCYLPAIIALPSPYLPAFCIRRRCEFAKYIPEPGLRRDQTDQQEIIDDLSQADAALVRLISEWPAEPIEAARAVAAASLVIRAACRRAEAMLARWREYEEREGRG